MTATEKGPDSDKRDLLADRKLRMTAGLATAIQQTLAGSDQLREQLASIAKAMEPILEARRRIGESMAPAMEWAIQIGKTVEAIKVGLPRAIEIGSEYKRWFESISRDAAKAMAELPAAMQQGLVAMAQEGWYLDPEMPITAVREFQQELENGSRDEILLLIAEYYRQEIDRILEDLKSNHPRRASIIQNAFDAHKTGQLDLSVPVLLIQADGICHDITKRELFSQQPARGLGSYVAEMDAKLFERILLYPFGQTIQINASRDKRAQGFDALNRHMVLHGESLSYGTEVNGLKAISLINFVSFALRRDPPPDASGET